MALTELKVEIPAATVEETDGVLLEVGNEGWSLLEDAIAHRAWIIGIFPERREAQARWRELRALLPSAPWGKATLRPLADCDWRDSYKAHFHAWQFGRLHWVPIWEKETFVLPCGDAVLWLDPGLAFGTGNHETTRLCCERLVTLGADPAGGRVIDAGCGSGILALSAALLGFAEIAAFDNDPEAVRVSEENASRNGLPARVQFFTADLAGGLAGRQAEVVLANIQSDVLRGGRGSLLGAVAPGGTLILSGILATERAVVSSAFAEAAPAWNLESRILGEWCDVVLRRPHGPCASGRPDC